MFFWMTLTLATWARPTPITVAPGAHALVFDLSAANRGAARGLVRSDRVGLSDLTGLMASHPHRAVVIHFFRTSEGGRGLPALESIRRRYRDERVAVLAIATDQPSLASLKDWTSDKDVRFPVLHDAHRIVASRYAISAYPLTLIVDADGRLFAVGQPKASELEAEVASELVGLLRGR